MSADRKKIILVVTDNGLCSGGGLQQVLAAHGAADAIHLDGGGSTKMWIRGKGYVNANTNEDRQIPVAIIARPNGECPSDCGNSLCVQMGRKYGWRAQCVSQPCRAGLSTIWTCDEPGVRRVHCDNGIVVSEHCGQKCDPKPDPMPDECLGGVVPEPMPDAGADSGMMPPPPTSDSGGPPPQRRRAADAA
jgi:hypothetical protein